MRDVGKLGFLYFRNSFRRRFRSRLRFILVCVFARGVVAYAWRGLA
jgi:hypothetical protein